MARRKRKRRVIVKIAKLRGSWCPLSKARRCLRERCGMWFGECAPLSLIKVVGSLRLDMRDLTTTISTGQHYAQAAAAEVAQSINGVGCAIPEVPAPARPWPFI